MFWGFSSPHLITKHNLLLECNISQVRDTSQQQDLFRMMRLLELLDTVNDQLNAVVPYICMARCA